MIPLFLLKLTIPAGLTTLPDAMRYDIIQRGMQRIVPSLVTYAVEVAQAEAPGKRLKNEIAGSVLVSTIDTVEGHVYMPWKLGYTITGTPPHRIPGPAPTKAASAAIQLDRGYPMTFYWEKVGAIVHFWSVEHLGQKPQFWAHRVFAKVQIEAQERFGEVMEKIAGRWAGVTEMRM